MESDINTILAIVKSTSSTTGGALAIASAAMYGLIKLLRLSLVQAVLTKISPKLAWSSWPKWGAAGVVMVLSLIGAFLSGLALGQPWVSALIAAFVAALPIGLGAMGVDAAVGTVVAKPALPDSKPNP